MDIKEIATRGHNHAVRNGFYFQDSESAIISKLIEEIEEFETGIMCRLHSDIEKFNNSDTFSRNEWNKLFEEKIKNTIGDELADIIITALSGAVELGVDIESHIEAKMIYNESRRY